MAQPHQSAHDGPRIDVGLLRPPGHQAGELERIRMSISTSKLGVSVKGGLAQPLVSNDSRLTNWPLTCDVAMQEGFVSGSPGGRIIKRASRRFRLHGGGVLLMIAWVTSFFDPRPHEQRGNSFGVRCVCMPFKKSVPCRLVSSSDSLHPWAVSPGSAKQTDSSAQSKTESSQGLLTSDGHELAT